ncbi:MAG TPA: peptidoglycan-binding domain-containing protein [Acetobacteraceae bacterium]|jgi:peptidoglycan hydrolase-like protein with peptidoglycan-binding domain|nr:peptidoglycan-binding domain-containing protein [Acetobacteraceae bacterium]
MNIRTLAFAVCSIAVGGLAACSHSEPPPPPPPPAPVAAPAPPPPPAMPANLTPAQQKVAHVQMALNANGAALDVDGKWGSKTSAALAAYQKAHSLKPTGKMNGATAKALGL